MDICYNTQSTVEEKNHFIIGFEVTNDVNDFRQLSNMGLRAKEILGSDNINILADKGYYNPVEIMKCGKNIIPYLPIIEHNRSTKDNEKYCLNNFKYYSSEDYYLCPENTILKRQSNNRKKDNKI